MEFYENEAAFLSAYTNWKLKSGGKPCVSLSELQDALAKFLKSSYYSYEYKKMKEFNFSSTETLAKQFEKLSKAHKPSFKYDKDNFYPTYSFNDLTDSDNKWDHLYSFLFDARYSSFKPERVQTNVGVSAKNKHNALLAAHSLTEEMARLYIKNVIESGELWPNKDTNPYLILRYDVPSACHLPGNKEYFLNFYKHAAECIGSLLEKNEGKLKLTNDVGGSLAFNYLSRIVIDYPLLSKLLKKQNENKKDKVFDIEITPKGVRCNSRRFVENENQSIFTNAAEEEKEI